MRVYRERATGYDVCMKCAQSAFAGIAGLPADDQGVSVSAFDPVQERPDPNATCASCDQSLHDAFDCR